MCHATGMFQLKGSILLTQDVPNVTMKIYYEQKVSNITLDSTTMSKFLSHTSRQFYEQNSSDIPANSSTLSKIPLIYQQTAL
jgi:hypothetical protein